MTCNICSSKSVLLFEKTVLNAHQVKYYQCQQCGFMQTEKPFWLNVAYSSAISDMDTGILVRNQLNVQVTKKIISYFFDTNRSFLDYGGGYGVFTRSMRDNGYNYLTYDKYCDPIFAKQFEIDQLTPEHQFELITAFELFEHVESPLLQLKEILKHTNNVFISTTLQPKNQSDLENWHYLVPETGQHISFYTLDSLKHIASQLGINLVSNGYNYHLFSKSKINSTLFKLICSTRTNKLIPVKNKKETLIFKDFDAAKKKSKS